MAKSKGILKNTMIVGAFTALSRVFGLVREMFQSRLIGAGVEQSAFTLAFAIPNAARKLFGEGALTAAFVPIFKGSVESETLEKAAKLARSVMTMVLLMLGAIVLIAMGSLEVVVKFRNELGLQDMERLKLTIRLVKTLLPYMIFICGAAFGMGVMNALGKFRASSFMPCILNIFWIGILVWISFFPGMRLDQRIHRVAMAILVAGAVQMFFMFWCMAKAGITPRLSFAGWGDEKVRLVWHNIAIAALGAGAIQINYMLDQFLAQIASPWAAGVIGYAERLMDLPLGIIGVAFGTVLLPTFAGLFAKGDIDGARSTLASSVKSLMFIMLPAAAGLFALAPEITSVIYEGGDFDSMATIRVSRALAVYSLGLGFFGFSKSIVPWFHAQNDMKTPLHVAVGTVVLNASLNIIAVLLLPVEWRHVGLAASTVVCSAAGCCALIIFARRKNGCLGLIAIIPNIFKMGSVALFMGCTIWFLRFPIKNLVANLLSGKVAANIFSLGALVVLGGLIYGATSCLVLRGEVKTLLKRRKRPQSTKL
ncbi:MAG: murein biosynthesis integral membrane protein MurJ [Kiritimatiellae bacterium]|nr:murein biosynthesis integral membrane protein MurJ [Kiritimatiellia bacterium]